jgi:glycosyltransferase involved in cell wall biosynthesis
MSTFPSPPKVAQPAGPGPKPFWSVVIPSYNRSGYLERALTSVLSQGESAGEMQIEVVDDASTADDPEMLVRRLAGDQVSFFRQPSNVGAAANWNTGIDRSRGEWVHILHSDDIVFPGFYARLKTAMEGRNGLGAAFCRTALIDENERWQGTSELLSPTP